TRDARHQPMTGPESPARGTGSAGTGRRRRHTGAADAVNALRRLDEFRNTSVRLLYDLVDQATNGFEREKMPDHLGTGEVLVVLNGWVKVRPSGSGKKPPCPRILPAGAAWFRRDSTDVAVEIEALGPETSAGGPRYLVLKKASMDLAMAASPLLA